jgi:RNA polymerase sigma-70 factor (ECF subfamily)
MAEDDFSALVQTTSPRLYRLALRLTGSPSDAEDVLQEAYLRAYLALSEGRFEGRASLATWLYRSTVNAALDALRRRRRRLALSNWYRPATSQPAEHTEARALLADAAALLAALPPEQAGALVLTQVEGLTNAEAAELLGCTEGAVEQRLIRARATLRRRAEP